MYSRSASTSYESGNTARNTAPAMPARRQREIKSERKIPKQMKKAPAIVNYDFTLLFSVALLFGFGLMSIYSGAQYSTLVAENDGIHFFFKQLKIGGIGLLVAIVLSLVGYNWIGGRPFNRFFNEGCMIFAGYIAVIGMLVYTLFLGKSSHGKSRWITVFGSQVQPAEFAKLAVILAVAFLISKYRNRPDWRKIKTRIWFAAIFPALIILPQNISSAVIVASIGTVMIFAADNDYKLFAVFGISVTAAYFISKPLIKAIVIKGGITERPNQYYLRRIFAWACPEVFEADAYQTKQGLYAIGSGGLTGHGLGESIQKFGKIPEVQNDMIFTIICEELGFLGALALFIVFGILLYRILHIAMHATDSFGALICTGVLAHIGIQIILNIAVVTGSMPNTGVTLPFISYGGSAILCTMAEMGLVLGVASRTRY